MVRSSNDPNYLTISQAANELEVKFPTVHGALEDGRLPFVLLNNRKLIRRADLDAYILRTRPDGVKPRGRPPGGKNKLREEQAEERKGQDR